MMGWLGEIFPTGSATNDPLLSFMLFYLPIMFLIVYGQKIQMWMVLNEVGRALKKFKAMRDKARNEVIDHIKGFVKPDVDLTKKVDGFLEYFTISPVDLDPSGIIRKLDHLMFVKDERMERELELLVKDADKVQLSVMENLLEVASELNYIYKVVRHYYLLGKKMANLYILLQIQMLMPIILQEAEALVGAIDGIKAMQPLGDGIGPMVVGGFMVGKEKKLLAKDTVIAEDEIKGRRVIFMKAKGPAGNVGKPGKAIRRLIDEMKVKIKLIVMIDAALKLEGEKSGEVAEGIGAAIGGIGVDKYEIEEVATEYKIPLYAIVIKESIAEAISVLRSEIAKAKDKVIEAIYRLIDEKTSKGDVVLVVGVGNTLGIGQ